jgi:hypothetical protein
VTVMLITSRLTDWAYVYADLIKEAAMRKTVVVLVLAALVSAAAAEVIAAPARSVAVNRFHYSGLVGMIHIATPSNVKSFPSELIPQ